MLLYLVVMMDIGNYRNHGLIREGSDARVEDQDSPNMES